MASSFVIGRPSEVPHYELKPLPDGRWHLEHYTKIQSNSAVTPALFEKKGTLYRGDTGDGTNVEAFAGLRLLDIYAQRVRLDGGQEECVVRVYEQIPETAEVQAGGLRRVTDEDGRDLLEATFLQFTRKPDGTINPETPGMISQTTAPGRADCVLDNEKSDDDGTLRTITRQYLQATDTPTLIGRWTVRVADVRAFKITGTGSDGDPFIYKPVREFIGRYLVAGDGSGPGNWLGLNTPFFTGATPFPDYQRYLTDEDVVHKGLVSATIERVYTELPDTFSFPREINFDFPGVLGARPPTTGKTVATVTERYTLGLPTTTALGYNLKRYATAYLTATVAGDSASTSTVDFKSGYLSGGYGLSAENSTINGIKYDSYILTSDSDPTNYPAAGSKVVSSDPELWRGMIWRVTDVSVVF